MGSDRRDATMHGLIRQSLAKTGGKRENCLGPEVLAAYYEGSLDSSEKRRCESHVSQCARCREQLAMMVRVERSPERVASHRGWLWDWRLLAYAVAALVIVTVWGVRRYSPTSPPSLKPLVAMSRPEQPPASQPPAPQPGVPSSQTSAKAPRTDRRVTLVAPPVLDQLIPKAATTTPEQAARAQNEIEGLPLNAREHDDFLKLRQGTRAEAKKQMSNNAPAAAAPEVAADSVSAPGTSGDIGVAGVPSRAAAADASGAPAATARDNKAVPPARRANGVGDAVGGKVGQVAAQRSASTIIQTPDPKVLWRLAGGNFIERTQDGGATWHGQIADADAVLIAGSAPNTKVCWLVGKSGTILVTRDATHWKKIPPPVPADFVTVDAKSASSAIVTALDGQKFSTENAGKRWVPIH